MQKEKIIPFYEDPTFIILKQYENLRESTSSEKWDDYNTLRKYLYSLRHNFKILLDHLDSLDKLNIIGLNGLNRWKQQRITHCLIGNMIASLQSVFEVFIDAHEIQSIRNSNLGQFLRTLRNYHIHSKHISTSMNGKSIKYEDYVITTKDENIKVDSYIVYLESVIEEANQKQQTNIIHLLENLHQYVESNFEKSIPLISIIDEVTLNTISNAEEYLLYMAIENKSEIERLIELYSQFVNFKEELGKPKDFTICDLKLRYLRIAKAFILNNE